MSGRKIQRITEGGVWLRDLASAVDADRAQIDRTSINVEMADRRNGGYGTHEMEIRIFSLDAVTMRVGSPPMSASASREYGARQAWRWARFVSPTPDDDQAVAEAACLWWADELRRIEGKS